MYFVGILVGSVVTFAISRLIARIAGRWIKNPTKLFVANVCSFAFATLGLVYLLASAGFSLPLASRVAAIIFGIPAAVWILYDLRRLRTATSAPGALALSWAGLAAGAWLVTVAPLPFVSAWWEAGAADPGDALKKRHRIADWLILTDALTGKSRAELVAELGEPPPTAYFRNLGLVYPLGMERSLIAVDHEWLVIEFDATGNATRISIRRD